MSVATKAAASATIAVLLMNGLATAAEEIQGTTIRPVLEEAQVEGCRVARPGDYDVAVNDLIELDYTFPAVSPDIPKQAGFRPSKVGAVDVSPLGIRRVGTPNRFGVGTIAFYFEAKKTGKETLTLTIDAKHNTYTFNVSKMPSSPVMFIGKRPISVRL